MVEWSATSVCREKTENETLDKIKGSTEELRVGIKVQAGKAKGK